MKKAMLVLGILFFFSNITFACDYEVRDGQIVHLPSGNRFFNEKSVGLDSFACVGSSLAVLASSHSIDLKFKKLLSVYYNGFLSMSHDLTAVAPNFISDKLYVSVLNNQFMIVSKFEFATIQREEVKLYYDLKGQFSEGSLLIPRKNCSYFHLDTLNMQAFSIVSGKAFSVISERLIREIEDDFKQSLPSNVDKDKTKTNMSFRSVRCTKENFSAILNIRLTHESVNTFLEKTPLIFLDANSSSPLLLEYNGEYLQMYLRADGDVLAYQMNSPVIHIFSSKGVFLGELDPTQ